MKNEYLGTFQDLIFMFVCVLVCICECVHVSSGASRDQRRVLEPPELEL